ncbi:MAG: AAA family ATPase [Ignavibacteriaceae bacterium]
MNKLIGRDSEKHALRHYLDNLNNSNGRIILVSGEAGVGKTAFVEDVLHTVEITHYTARANEDINSPYSLFTGILRSCLRENRKIECGPFKKYLAVLLPEIGSPPEDIEAETLKEAIVSAVISISANQPLVIFFDDIQCADNASIDMLPLLADKISGHPVLIICTYRTEEITHEHRIRKLRSELKRARKLNEINLAALGYDTTRELVEIILNKKISEKAAETIYNHTLGYPLFTEEIIESLLENNILFEINDEFDIKNEGIIPVPESIKDIVLQKLSSLSDTGKELLEAASLLGSEFQLSMLEKLSGNEEGIDELFEKNWLTETNDCASFKHTLIREAVKSQINWSRKKQIHKQIAEYLENNNALPELIAEHWLAAKENDKAIDALINSIENYFNVYAYEDAARAAGKALEMWQPDFDLNKKVQILKKYAYCTQLSGKTDESITVLKEIIEIAEIKKNIKIMPDTYRSLAAAYGLKALWELSVQSRILAAEYFQKCGLPGEAALEYLLAAGKCTAMLQLDNAADLAKKSISIAEDAGITSIRARAMGLYGNVLAMLGKTDEGKQIVYDALSIALNSNDTNTASEVYRRLATTLEYASDYQGARSVYVNAYDFCVNNGEEINARVCLSCMSYLFFQTGEWKKSLDMCREVLTSEYTPPTSLPVGYGMTGLIQALRGETKTALKNLNKSLQLARKFRNAITELCALWGLAICHENQSDFKAAEDCYNTILSRWHDIYDMHDIIPILMWASMFFNKRNLKKEITKTAEILTRIAGETGNPEAMGVLAFTLAESAVLNNNLEEALGQYSQALVLLERPGNPLEQLVTEYRLSLVLIKTGDNETAEKYLSKALRTAKNLGTRPLASEISNAMLSIGLKTEESRNPDSADRANKFGLTQRQYEILQLVGEGLTNKEIANKIFLSARTVDMHVSNILQRLNCRTRTEAISKAKEFTLTD